LTNGPPVALLQDANTARRVILFGYVRGTFLKPGMRVHVPGLGNYSYASNSILIASDGSSDDV
jgi:ribosome biogenesis protein BMS1